MHFHNDLIIGNDFYNRFGNRGGVKLLQLISGSSAAIDEIPTAIPIFSLMPDSTVIYATSPEVVFSCKSKMAAAKPEILLS